MNRQPMFVRFRTAILLSTLCGGYAALSVGPARADDPTGANAQVGAEAFDYFTNNWNVIGLKDYLRGSRITPENRLMLVGDRTIQIRLGSDQTPLTREHPKRLLHDWMPIVIVRAERDGVAYEFTFWATPLPDVRDWQQAFDWPSEGENFLDWIRVRATNVGAATTTACVDINETTTPDAAQPQAPQGVPEPLPSYAWSWELKPGESAEAVAQYTFEPVESATRFEREAADIWLSRCESFWQGLLEQRAQIEVPCSKATAALRAAHVCQMIANDHGEVHGGEGFYDEFYIRDGAYQVLELEEAGLSDAAAKAVELYLVRQREDGRFESQENQFDANGQAVWTLWQHYLMTRDLQFLARVYPQMRRAAEWTMQIRRTTSAPFAGLLPTAPADGEYLWEAQHHIVGYDLWNLRGMLCTLAAARVLGNQEDVAKLESESAAYRRDIDAAWSATRLAHFPPSWEGDGTHWGNTETLWPTELFARDDTRVAALSDFVRQQFAGGYIEGTIQWKGGGAVQAIHPYMGAYTTMTDLVRGRHEQVVEDFYWYLLHSTAAHAFPEGIYYQRRFAWGDTIPHVTGACNYAVMLRHMLVHETEDELWLLPAVPDGWLEAGQEIRIARLPTHFGEMSLQVRGTAEGVQVEISPPRRNPPQRVALYLPASRPVVGELPGVQLRTRSQQSKRWDFASVVAQYESTYDWTKPNVVSLSTGKPATCSHALPGFTAELANDGRSCDVDSYWATDVAKQPGPAWWQVDLEQSVEIGRVVVVGYYGDKRSYGFTVETSVDGVAWSMAADWRGNTQPAAEAGYECCFEPRQARYVRVTQYENSANSGRHLVEVQVYSR
jgi:hypothetical protein